jgi:hypothetical protein
LSIKSSVKKMARPLMGRFYARTDNAIEARVVPLSAGIEARQGATDVRLDTAEAELLALRTDIEAFSRYLPTVINTIASQNATGREHERRMAALTERIDRIQEATGRMDSDLTARLEFIRREMMFEQRYERETRPAAESVEPSVVNQAKLDAMGDRIRLNVGAGHVAKEDYLNVDTRELPGIDIVADVRGLPFEPEELDEIYSAHVLEHFPV